MEETQLTGKVILIGNESLGAPDRDLGMLLMGNFLRILGERASLPSYIILWNTGALLAVEGSGTVDHLRKLQERGVKVICCRTCAEYFGIEDKLGVGQIDGMVGILELLSTSQVITV